jgi:hypothetical protein
MDDILLWADYREIRKVAQTFGLFFPYALILTMNELGYILGDFFTNSSSHPEPVTPIESIKNRASETLVRPG